MTAFDKPFLFLRSPHGGVETLSLAKAAGFQGVFCNIGDFPVEDWEQIIRPRALFNGMSCGPWLRTQGADGKFSQAKLQQLIATADKWASPLVVNSEKEIDNSGAVITSQIAAAVGTRDGAISMEAWPFGSVDWKPVGHLPVLPQIFPPDWGWASKTKDEIMTRATSSKDTWHLRGMRCCYFTFATYGAMKPTQYELQAPYSLYTADDAGESNYGNWKPTSAGFKGCIEVPESPKKPVKQYRAEIEAIAKEAVALHNLGPNSRLRIIERIASEEFPDAQWKIDLGPEISLLLDQAKADE